MTNQVYDLWVGISVMVPTISREREFDNYRLAAIERPTIEGMIDFERIRALIERRIQSYDIKTLTALFTHGPWNDTGLQDALKRLSAIGEYSNVVNYLFACALKRLSQLGEAGRSAVQELAESKDGFRGYTYHANGAQDGEVVRLEKIVNEILRE